MPHVDDTLTLPDGRRLAWAEWGEPDGRPVVLLHCSPGSRLFCPDEGATSAAGVRLITVDRPGYGGSSASPDPTITGFAADLAALIDHLGLDRLAVAGWSGGGIYAAAFAAHHHDRLTSLSLLCTPGPDDEVPWLGDGERALGEVVRKDPVAGLAQVRQAMGWYAAAPDQVLGVWTGPAEDAARARPGVADRLLAMWREGARAGVDGMAFDVVAGSRAWGFDPVEVTAPSHLWYGEADEGIGVEHGRWWADHLPDAHLTTVPDSGHLLPLVAWPEVLAAAD